jgi:hypothetical protein
LSGVGYCCPTAVDDPGVADGAEALAVADAAGAAPAVLPQAVSATALALITKARETLRRRTGCISKLTGTDAIPFVEPHAIHTCVRQERFISP